MKNWIKLTLLLIGIFVLLSNACNAQVTTIKYSENAVEFVSSDQLKLNIEIDPIFVALTPSHYVTYELIATNGVDTPKVWDLAGYRNVKQIILSKGNWKIHLNTVICRYAPNQCDTLIKFQSNALSFVF